MSYKKKGEEDFCIFAYMSEEYLRKGIKDLITLVTLGRKTGCLRNREKKRLSTLSTLCKLFV